MDEPEVNEECVDLIWRRFISSLTNQNILLQPDEWSWYRPLNVNSIISTAYYIDNTIIVHPQVALGTLAVRGNKKLTSNTIAYWEIDIPHVYGTSIMFGIGTADAKMSSPTCFENLLGNDNDKTMGLSHKGYVFRNYKKQQFCNSLNNSAVIGILFNGIEKTLSYFINHNYMGIAFNNINTNNTYYPMISTTAQKTQFLLQNLMSYEINIIRNPDLLKNICLNAIIKYFPSHKNNIINLPKFLLYQIIEYSITHNNEKALNYFTSCLRN